MGDRKHIARKRRSELHDRTLSPAGLTVLRPGVETLGWGYSGSQF